MVEPDNFVNLGQVRDCLGLRSRFGVNLLLSRKVLDPCLCGDLESATSCGATKASVEPELERRRTASLGERVLWRVRAVLHYF